jgi:thiol:disulfide interchange protein DsbD
MIKQTSLRIGVALLAALAVASAAFAQNSDRVVKAKGYISADSVRPGDKFKVAVALDITPGYHINAHVPSLDYLFATDTSFEAPAGVTIEQVAYPAAQPRTFEFAPDTPLAVHEGTVFIIANAVAADSIQAGELLLRAKAQVQACNDSQCLAPATIDLEIPIKVVAAGSVVKEANSDVFAKAAAAPAGPVDPGGGSTPRNGTSTGGGTTIKVFGGNATRDSISDLVSNRGIVVALLVVFLAGLALNTTPCVYPIIPITIGFFINQSERAGGHRLRRTFAMSSMYVLGMALTYSVLGVVASLTKGIFGAALQSPVVLIGLALLMVALALSMFGVYEFRLPEFLNRFASQSTQSTSGLVGALVMGLTMGIVAAPCIGPFVVGLLVHVGTKGDPVYGFSMFFVLALGLGAPYLVLGTFSGALKSLPRSGEWMVAVRKVFGLVLIGMAIYFLLPLMGDYARMVLVAFFALSALYLIFWEAGRTKPRQFAWILRGLGVAAAVVAVVMILPKRTDAGVPWQPYSEQSLAEAKRDGKAVIIDAFADWCIPCKELDQATFTDSAVKKEAERFVTLKLDLTSNDPQSESGRARQRFDVLGVPTILFVDSNGSERPDLRLEGFEKPARFVERMKRLETVATPAVSRGLDAADKPAPSITLSMVDGSSFDLAQSRGKVVVLDFWATWCLPCISEIPMFNRLHQEYGEKGLSVVGVSLDEDTTLVKPFLKKYPMGYSVALGDKGVASKLAVDDSSLPVALIIDKHGRVRFRHVGITKEETFRSEIDSLLAE